MFWRLRMIEINRVKAILFDSGRVLNHPRTGHWFIPPNFYNYVDKSLFEIIPSKSLKMAFQKSIEYLESKNLIITEIEELEHFNQFYRIFAHELPGIELGENEIKKIAEDTVFNDEKFFFYEDVFEVVPQLSKKYTLGVVSDTWPSLDRVFRNIGLRKYFSSFVMSSILGVVKPHELMFNTALTELDVKPEEAIFIDDSIRNLEGARRLGIQTILMLRDEEIDGLHSGHVCINSLKDLEQLFLW
jgi:putative hydrolase of the HAD superfamily